MADPRVEAVATALVARFGAGYGVGADAAVAALDAYDREHDPLHLAGMATVERDLRERIARDIEAMPANPFHAVCEDDYNAALRDAARIIREGNDHA